MTGERISGVKAVERTRGEECLLEVSGEILAGLTGGSIRAEAMPDGFNGAIALVDVVVEGGAPGGPETYPFSIERAIQPGQYSQATINPGQDGSVTVEVVREGGKVG